MDIAAAPAFGEGPEALRSGKRGDLGRGAEHAVRHLAGFSGVLQVDGYAGYDKLTDPARAGGPLTLALCWSHFRRRFYEIAKSGNAPIATEALARIGALYEIEATIRRIYEERLLETNPDREL
mgnify:CR=1 FL=1